MAITFVGWILIPLGIAFYCCRKQYLYPLTIFLVPFSATAVMNVGTGDSDSGLPAALFVGCLWIATEIRSRSLSMTGESHLNKSRRRLQSFLVVVFISLLMPLWINGGLEIESAMLLDTTATPLRFSLKHVTQTLYLVYGILLSLSIARKNVVVSEFMRTLRIFVCSAMFVSVWGFFQLGCSWLNIPYPAFLFNSSSTPSAQGYAELVDTLGTQRISSVTTEPSIFAVCMLIALTFVLFATVSRTPIISRIWDRLATGILILGLILSTSTTAYLGLAFVLALYCCALIYVRILGLRHLLKLIVFFAILWGIYLVSPPVRDLVGAVLVNKAETYSALETMKSYILAWSYFRAYPILGLGWGSVTSRDLVLKLLSNTGVLGCAAFLWFLLRSLLSLWHAARVNTVPNQARRWCAISICSAFLAVIVLNVITGFEYSYAQLWFVIGLAIAVPAMSAEALQAPPRVHLRTT